MEFYIILRSSSLWVFSVVQSQSQSRKQCPPVTVLVLRRPVEGSKTAERGRLAQIQMIGDMVELCDMIYDCGIRSPDGRAAISFGDAFRVSLLTHAEAIHMLYTFSYIVCTCLKHHRNA